MLEVVPFRVKTLPLSENISFVLGSIDNEMEDTEYMKRRAANKIWTVVAIRPNSFRYHTHTRQVIEPSVRVRGNEPSVGYLYLLVRPGETPIWWPDRYCEVWRIP